MQKRSTILQQNANIYFSNKNIDEKNRLDCQQKLLYKFDFEVYKKYLSKRKSLTILDLGCHNGETSYQRFKHFDIKQYVGLDINQENIKAATKKIGNDRYHFFSCDLESTDFENNLQNFMKELNIEKFDVINALALFAHLKNPSKVISIALKYCTQDCLIFVRNIDDGFNLCYPSKYAKKALSFLDSSRFSGYRKGGREVNAILKNGGVKNVVLEKNGISNIGLDLTYKKYYFSTIFDFILLTAQKEYELDAISNAEKKLNYLSKNWDNIKKEFFSDNFFINLGFMFYVGKGKI